MDNSELKGDFPKNVNGHISYGSQISSFLVALSTVGAVSTDRIKEISGSILNLPISKETIVSMVSRLSEKIQPVLAVIKNAYLFHLLLMPMKQAQEYKVRPDGYTVRSHHCILFLDTVRNEAQKE